MLYAYKRVVRKRMILPTGTMHDPRYNWANESEERCRITLRGVFRVVQVGYAYQIEEQQKQRICPTIEQCSVGCSEAPDDGLYHEGCRELDETRMS